MLKVLNEQYCFILTFKIETPLLSSFLFVSYDCDITASTSHGIKMCV